MKRQANSSHKGTGPAASVQVVLEEVVLLMTRARGEPIVGTPEGCLPLLYAHGYGSAFIGNCFLRKEDQDPSRTKDHKSAFELD
jgi:carbamoyltransferase